MKAPRGIWLLTTGLLIGLMVPALAQGASVAPTATASLAGTGTTPAASAVFTMTNNASGNSVIAYTVGSTGALSAAGTFRTHGLGTGASLADQGALALTADYRWLLVVDGGSNQISVFHVNPASRYAPILSFSGRVSSGGVMPVSLAVHGAWVYVLNAGNATVAGNIAGFRLTAAGLVTLPGSHEPLSSSAPTGPAQVSFNPAGTVLVVAEKATSLLDSYTVDSHGIASAPWTTNSSGSTPYGFAFAPSGTLVVSEAGPGALSSYSVSGTGTISVISPTVLDNQSAPCWVVLAGGGRWAYTTNAHSDSISTYTLARNGTLVLQASVGATTGSAPTDMAVTTSTGRYVLVYDAGAGQIDEFAVGAGGTLTATTSVYGLPLTSEGLVAF